MSSSSRRPRALREAAPGLFSQALQASQEQEHSMSSALEPAPVPLQALHALQSHPHVPSSSTSPTALDEIRVPSCPALPDPEALLMPYLASTSSSVPVRSARLAFTASAASRLRPWPNPSRTAVCDVPRCRATARTKIE